MEMERSLAADREKRLNSKIDDLTRLVSSLKEVIMESGSPTYSMAAAKAVGHDETKSKGKPRHAAHAAVSKLVNKLKLSLQSPYDLRMCQHLKTSFSSHLHVRGR